MRKDLEWTGDVTRHDDTYLPAILAIEAEARVAALDEARAELRNLRRSRLVGLPAHRHLESGPEGHLLDLSEALAAIDALRSSDE